MNTHILVPIINIEVKIQQLKLISMNPHHAEDAGTIKGQIDILNQLLREGKQISLDETHEDIVVKCSDEWSKEYVGREAGTFHASASLDGRIKGYKQAMNELLLDKELNDKEG